MTSAIPALKKKYNEAKLLADRQKFVESNSVLEMVYSHALVAGDKKFTGEALSLFGHNNYSLGNYEQCLQQFLEAEKIFKELKMLRELSEAESNLGAVYKRLGLYAHSLFKNLEALTYSFQTNEEYIMACSLSTAASALFETGYTEKAFRATDTAMLVCDKNSTDIKYVELKLVILNNKATFLAALKRFGEMLKLLQRAKAIASEYAIESRYSLIDSNMSFCLINLNRPDEGYRLLQQVVKKKNIPHDDSYVANLVKMGLLYKEYLHDDENFLEHLNRALKLAEKLNLISRQIVIVTALKGHYSLKANLPEAGRLEKRLQTLKERENHNKQTGGMEQLFDTNLLAVENILREKEQEPGFLNRYDYLIGTYSYTVHRVTRQVLLRDIAFCEIRGNYLYIHMLIKTPAGKMALEEGHKLRKTMKEFIGEMHDSMPFFARIHNSYIVNLYWLEKDSVKGYGSLLIGGTELKISYTYRSSFKKKLNDFIERSIGLQ